MSLQVWLPLTGDLRNQGLSDINITSTVTFADNGKIGQKCLNSTTNYFDVPIMINKKQLSFAYWVKINEGTTTNWLDTITWVSTNGSTDVTNRQEFYYYSSDTETMTTGVWYPGNSNSGFANQKIGEWNHYAYTIDYENCITKFYINGLLKKTTTNVTAGHYIKNGKFRLRESTLNSSINDFRLYDHVLSDKEVEEISRGLVLHYKLDNDGLGNKNILPISMDLTKWPKESGVSVEWDSNKNMYKIITTGKTSSRWGIYQNITLTANTTYTFSVDGMKVDQACAFGFAEGNAWPSNAGSFTTDRQRLLKTITVGSADAICRIYLNVTCINGGTNNAYFALPKLEVGDVATDWSPAAVDGLTTDNIVYDSSGYQNNGIISGALISENDSPRYNLSMYFNGSSYVLTSAGNMGWNDLSELTLSCWMHPTASMTGWRGSWGIATDTTYVARGFAITDYGNEFRVTYTNGSTYVTLASGKTLPQNEWHHCAATLKDITVNMYFDGELVKTYTLNWGTATLNTNARIELGVDLPGSDEKFTGNYSDARLYATALTAEQILDLYHTSASIDKEGNVYTREVIE